jgi:hypothetical protein
MVIDLVAAANYNLPVVSLRLVDCDGLAHRTDFLLSGHDATVLFGALQQVNIRWFAR